MVDPVTYFSDEQRRVLINLEQHYEVWIDAVRAADGMPYGMKWVERSGKEYLYQLNDRVGNAKSLGPRSPETEGIFNRYKTLKGETDNRRETSGKTLAETCAIYRSLSLPQIPSEGAKILREADRRYMLGSKLLVVGTNAMPAYAVEAGGRINDAPMETDDFDMTWSALVTDPSDRGVMAMLKAADSTYTVNTERTFQARNSKAFEVEILAAPSTVPNMIRGDSPYPIPLPEQEWLLLGKKISRVVVGRDGSPGRLVVPDPRYFALQKLWLSKQEKRNHLKRPKDARQGAALLSAIANEMPQFPLDDAFLASLPSELMEEYEAWTASSTPATRPTPSWS
jgi:hypothetical protein